MNQKTFLLVVYLVCLCACYDYMEEWNPANKVYFGKTNEWRKFGDNGIFVDVNFDSLKLCKTPKVFTYLTCSNRCWQTTGQTSIYQLSEDHFRVFLYLSGLSV